MVYPEYIDIKDWFASLIVDYPNEFLPILESEEKWQETGAIIAGNGIFARANVPAPFALEEGHKKMKFASWQEWAKKVYLVMIDVPKTPDSR